jgi:hypothetical protein
LRHCLIVYIHEAQMPYVRRDGPDGLRGTSFILALEFGEVTGCRFGKSSLSVLVKSCKGVV